MTDKELQDLISLKKYEQPEEGYFDDFLIEFQQRQRSEILQTSARGLLLERIKAWFNEFGANRPMRWVLGGGLAYAAVALFMNLIPSYNEENSTGLTSHSSEVIESVKVTGIEQESQQEQVVNRVTVSMEYTQPVDFSIPKPIFSNGERFF